MRFVDHAVITVQSGRGGDGCVSFYRARNLAKGGPDGGNGGRGGDVILNCDASGLQTLLDFRYKRLFKAENGRPGAGKNRSGMGGKPLTLTLPAGTSVWNDHTEEMITDILPDQPPFVVARGGKGGLGNAHFKSSTRRAPRHATQGSSGQTRALRLELRLLADIGIVGLPNAGKSSLLAKLANAKPKIGHYPFTTLYPNLGSLHGAHAKPIVLADIPGIIENAHRGTGLGLDFLRHTTRNRLLWHTIELHPDAQGEFDWSTLEQHYSIIEHEFQHYSNLLQTLPRWIVLNKADRLKTLNSKQTQRLLKRCSERFEVPCYLISALDGYGINELTRAAQDWFHQQDASAHPPAPTTAHE